jgi:dipeptidyl aminopeptidase/acylaminoacyl peptidase
MRSLFLNFTFACLFLSACGGRVDGQGTPDPAQGTPADEPSSDLPSERAAVVATDPNDVWLAFDTSGGDDAIYVVRADGSALRKLDLGGPAHAPAFSANGKALAYAGVGGIWVRDLTTGQSLQLTEGGDGAPAWSPDGKLLAFTRDVDIWIVGADGTGERPFVKGPPPGEAWYTNYGHPVFTHDGASLIFDRYGALEIGPIDGSEHHVLLSTTGWGVPMATVSPDGEDIAVGADCGLRVVPLGTAAAACTTGTSLDTVSDIGARPSWSASGVLAYASSEYGLSTVPASGGAPTILLDTKESLGGVYVQEVAWSPPGTTLP